MHCHCKTNNRAPWWTFTDPCKPEVRPGAREESASPAWLAAPAMNARDTTLVYIWRLDNGCGPTLYKKCHSHNTPGKYKYKLALSLPTLPICDVISATWKPSSTPLKVYVYILIFCSALNILVWIAQIWDILNMLLKIKVEKKILGKFWAMHGNMPLTVKINVALT